MRQIVITLCAAVLGGLIGSRLALRQTAVAASTSDRIETRELVVVGNDNKPVARLQSIDGSTFLRFYDGGSEPAIEIGLEGRHNTRFLHVFAPEGKVVAALNSLAPNGAATLTLGDTHREARMILGALRSDVEQNDVEDWGIELRVPGSNQNVFRVHSGSLRKPPSAALNIRRASGRVWTVY